MVGSALCCRQKKFSFDQSSSHMAPQESWQEMVKIFGSLDKLCVEKITRKKTAENHAYTHAHTGFIAGCEMTVVHWIDFLKFEHMLQDYRFEKKMVRSFWEMISKKYILFYSRTAMFHYTRWFLSASHGTVFKYVCGFRLGRLCVKNLFSCAIYDGSSSAEAMFSAFSFK